MDEKILIKLCNRYGYSFKLVGEYIRIKSKRDAYYILNSKLRGSRIELYHENTSGNTYMHSHGKHSNLEGIFKAIYSHDHREFIRQNKMTRLMNIFKMIQ